MNGAQKEIYDRIEIVEQRLTEKIEKLHEKLDTQTAALVKINSGLDSHLNRFDDHLEDFGKIKGKIEWNQMILYLGLGGILMLEAILKFYNP